MVRWNTSAARSFEDAAKKRPSCFAAPWWCRCVMRVIVYVFITAGITQSFQSFFFYFLFRQIDPIWIWYLVETLAQAVNISFDKMKCHLSALISLARTARDPIHNINLGKSPLRERERERLKKLNHYGKKYTYRYI